MALKKEVAPQPYRMLLKVLKFAISRSLYGLGMHCLNTSEINFRAVEYETDLLRQLMYLLGYEVLLCMCIRSINAADPYSTRCVTVY
jgi:hypothetical protein